MRRTIGDGLLTAERSAHRQQKRYLTPVFYKERIQAYARIVQEETDRLADSLKDGVPVPMHELMMQLTLGIIARSLFHTELASDKSELAAAVDVTIRRTASTIFSPIILPFGLPTPENVKHKQAIRTLETMIRDAISAAKNDPSAYADSMLGLLLDTKDEEGKGDLRARSPRSDDDDAASRTRDDGQRVGMGLVCPGANARGRASLAWRA